jgi:hypothetical protein
MTVERDIDIHIEVTGDGIEQLEHGLFLGLTLEQALRVELTVDQARALAQRWVEFGLLDIHAPPESLDGREWPALIAWVRQRMEHHWVARGHGNRTEIRCAIGDELLPLRVRRVALMSVPELTLDQARGLAKRWSANQDCDCDEPDGPCEACDDEHGHTCIVCDEEFCTQCWEGPVHIAECERWKTEQSTALTVAECESLLTWVRQFMARPTSSARCRDEHAADVADMLFEAHDGSMDAATRPLCELAGWPC